MNEDELKQQQYIMQRLNEVVDVLSDFEMGRYDRFKTTVPYRDIEELCLRITEQRRQTHA